MDFEHLEEFYAVRESVYEGLHSGLYVKGDTGWPLCRFLVLPALENAIGWDVLSLRVRGKPAQPRLFRSCWRMDLDLHALGSPVERLKHPRPYRPTIEVSSTLIDAAKIEELIRRFYSIRVPLAVAKAPSGFDGTNYELELGHFFCRSRIAWWVRLPEEWEALAPVIEDLAGLFESSWQNASPDTAVDQTRGDGLVR